MQTVHEKQYGNGWVGKVMVGTYVTFGDKARPGEFAHSTLYSPEGREMAMSFNAPAEKAMGLVANLDRMYDYWRNELGLA